MNGRMNVAATLEELPDYLSERCRWISAGGKPVGSELVLYWLRTAMRADENPAFDVAKLLAHKLKLPLLIYQGLSERYAFASDRHHTFILQGAIDLQAAFSRHEASYAFHLERSAQNGDYLRQLARRAAIVVTEDMPVQAPQQFLRALTRGNAVPVLAVDTACVAPMNMVGRAYERAYQYREQTAQFYADRVSRDWPEAGTSCRPYALEKLPFSPLHFERERVGDLVAECEIDHTLGPVLDTPGGSGAGYARWNAFREKGLRHYAKKRNDPLVEGASRMSAYLHYGMVSPLRLAREAAAQSSEGAEKYLDELLIWRELAYCFCRFRPDHARFSALPPWARETLLAHQSDPRHALYSWEQLASGSTDDALWNAAQKSLLIHGELHNNVRMTWGKAILHWTRTPQQALKMILDLNHRFALDGRDPASYGGILWCLGQFDRPFEPEQPILGRVRPRPSTMHAQRLDPVRYAGKTTLSRSLPVPTIAVIGAGISGAIAARTLANHGLPVTVFEKSGGAGGRMSTRRNDFGSFDHGAQYFTAKDSRFKCYVQSWVEQGIACTWKGNIAVYDARGIYRQSSVMPRYVGVPGMNAIAKHLLGALQPRWNTLVSKIHRRSSRLALVDAAGEDLGTFDRVVVTAPAAQTAEMVSDIRELAEPIQKIPFDPCWAVLMTLSSELNCDWAGAFLNFGPLRWVARNSTKPGREPTPENWILHASPDWSLAHRDDDPASVTEQLVASFWQDTGLKPQTIDYVLAHRWLYSLPQQVAGHRCFSTADSHIVACGDWAGGPRVEGAFLSGCAAAGRILGSLPNVGERPPQQLSLF